MPSASQEVFSAALPWKRFTISMILYLYSFATVFVSVFVFICNLCLSYLYFKTANVFQHAFSVVREQEVGGKGSPC